MIGFQIMEVTATFIEVIIGLSIITKILGKGGAKYKESILAAGILTIFVWMLNQYSLFSAFTTLAAILGFTISGCLIYKANMADALILSVDYIILLYIIDFLILSFLGIVYKNSQIATVLINSFSGIRVQLLVLSKGLLFIIYSIINNYFINKIELRTWRSLLTGFLGIGGVYYLVKSAFLRLDIDIVFIGILLLSLAVLGIYSLNQYLSHIEENNKLMRAIEKNDLLVTHYQSIIENYYRNQSFYHDLKNQYLIIHNYLKNGEYEKAKEYMGNLKCINEIEAAGKWTGIDPLDILLTCKKIEAERFHIEVTIIAEHIDFKLSEQEIISLVGNLFDNGIEACKKAEGDKKWIQIIIRKVREMTFIKVVNTYKEEPRVQEGRFLTEKKNKAVHGFGIASIKLVVEKYKGNFDVSYDDGIFSVVISFFD